MRPRPLVCVICVQLIAGNMGRQNDPSVSVLEWNRLDRNVEKWRGYIRQRQGKIASINSKLQGESC